MYLLLLALFFTLKKPIHCCCKKSPVRNSNLELNMEKKLGNSWCFCWNFKILLLLWPTTCSFVILPVNQRLIWCLLNICFITLFISYTFINIFLSNFICYYHFLSRPSLRLQLILPLTFYFASPLFTIVYFLIYYHPILLSSFYHSIFRVIFMVANNCFYSKYH